MVRTDHNTQTLDSMFVPIVEDDKHRPSKRRKSEHGVAEAEMVENQQAVRVKIPQSDTVLTSVKELRQEVIERNDAGEWKELAPKRPRTDPTSNRRTGGHRQRSRIRRSG